MPHETTTRCTFPASQFGRSETTCELPQGHVGAHRFRFNVTVPESGCDAFRFNSAPVSPERETTRVPGMIKRDVRDAYEALHGAVAMTGCCTACGAPVVIISGPVNDITCHHVTATCYCGASFNLWPNTESSPPRRHDMSYTGWLIERRNPTRWLKSLLGSGYDDEDWTTVASEAALLETEQDAHNEIMRLRLGERCMAFPTEHQFIANRDWETAPVSPESSGPPASDVQQQKQDEGRTENVQEREPELEGEGSTVDAAVLALVTRAKEAAVHATAFEEAAQLRGLERALQRVVQPTDPAATWELTSTVAESSGGEPLTNLRALAEATGVGEGGWFKPEELREAYSVYDDGDGMRVVNQDDADFIAACDPQTILGLLDELASLRSSVASLGAAQSQWQAVLGERLEQLLTAQRENERLTLDVKRLDKLDSTREAIEGSDVLTSVDGEHERYVPTLLGYLWGVQGECDNVRDAIDAMPGVATETTNG
jgi:hypothetical protein